MSPVLDQPPPPRLRPTAQEKQVQREVWLKTILLRMAIWYELEGQAITMPGDTGAALGVPAAEAYKLLTQHHPQESDVAAIEEMAARLRTKVPRSSGRASGLMLQQWRNVFAKQPAIIANKELGMASSMEYSKSFYDGQKSGSVSSAEIIVPYIAKLFRPSNILDVGCGTGIWLREFMRQGIDDVLGLDGSYVDQQMLAIPSEKFCPTDLTLPLNPGRRFDLACCVEVAEHLPASVAQQLVKGLVAAAPVVVFSAAVPGQGGTNHINEQWQFYWHTLFATAGYVTVDCVRPAFYDNDHVSWWYRQNILVYCDRQAVPEGFPELDSKYDINRILPEMTLGPRNGTQAVATIRQSLPIISYVVKQRLKLRPSI